jgi:hypothetical protein
MELLARAQSGENDLDRLLRLGDHSLGHLGNADWLSHIEHQDLAGSPDRARLDHELDRFADGHEVSSDIRMGDCQRATVLDLGLEGA